MKTNSITFAILLAFTAGSLVTIANADEKKSSLNSADEKFIKRTGEAGTAEVKLATLGTQKAERADVKEFAAMLVTDHTKVNEELAKLLSLLHLSGAIAMVMLIGGHLIGVVYHTFVRRDGLLRRMM